MLILRWCIVSTLNLTPSPTPVVSTTVGAISREWATWIAIGKNSIHCLRLITYGPKMLSKQVKYTIGYARTSRWTNWFSFSSTSDSGAPKLSLGLPIVTSVVLGLFQCISHWFPLPVLFTLILTVYSWPKIGLWCSRGTGYMRMYRWSEFIIKLWALNRQSHGFPILLVDYNAFPSTVCLSQQIQCTRSMVRKGLWIFTLYILIAIGTIVQLQLYSHLLSRAR